MLMLGGILCFIRCGGIGLLCAGWGCGSVRSGGVGIFTPFCLLVSLRANLGLWLLKVVLVLLVLILSGLRSIGKGPAVAVFGLLTKLLFT